MHREQKSGYYIMGSPQQLSLQQHNFWMIQGHLIHPNYKLYQKEIFKSNLQSTGCLSQHGTGSIGQGLDNFLRLCFW